MKFGHSITNVIEFENETSTATVADKVAQFNESSRRMIEDRAQNGASPATQEAIMCGSELSKRLDELRTPFL